MKLEVLIAYLNEIAPQHFQEDYDNAGLIVGDHNLEIKGVLICLDAIEAVVDEAILLNCNVIVAHHPIVFKGLKRFNGQNYIERTVIKAIKNDIAIFAIHTNLDNVFSSGVNGQICKKIGLTKLSILSPKPGVLHGDFPIGAGMIGELKQAMPCLEFMEHLKKTMDLKVVKHTAFISDQISKVAVCGGSGGFLLSVAKSSGADIFITSDYKYHEFFDANNEIVIADIGHYESEKFTIELLYDLIINKFSNFAAHYTKINTNPIKYL